ncbi:RNA ligase [Methanolobus halotolerans]|uniref:RNA ligase n=1 Tax=Methanolobus halotolerans TaxID=2052935 RepID=A0A4E0QQ81_9EURY|nr:RNA ligase [Methanolobus halotolerans]TGC07235.1 RNA ligase [Methanolobus halotolerans]
MNNEDEIDIEKAAEFLGLPPSRLSELLKKRTIVRNWGEYEDIFRFDNHISGIETGSVFIKKGNDFEMIRGFPKIKRAMTLFPAIERNFPDIGSVLVEEKMNGYNVRVTGHKGELITLTRSGHVCPYSTERAQHLLNHDFFTENPDLVIYGEMVGPDNPYVPKDIYGVKSLDLFVFDIRSKFDGAPLPVIERRELASDYGFSQVELFGEFGIEEAPSKITRIIRELGKKEHEGVIIKDPEMVLQPIKYTCSESNCADLRHAFRFYNDSGRDYMFPRIVREGFQSAEWNENEEELRKRCLRLGESILRPMIRSIREVQRDERISDDVRIRVRNRDTIDRFRAYLERLGVDVIFGPPEKIGEDYLVRISKLNKSTTDKTKSIVEGQLWS